jgi:DHA1 family multidrug resistance protein-like MFS transporter
MYFPQSFKLTTSPRIITSIFYALCCFSSTFASGVLSPGTVEISRRFQVSSEVTTFSTATLFLLGYFAGPFVWAPMSESQGRKISTAIAMFGFVCFGAGSATAKDYQTLCLTRFFQGVMGACPVSITTAVYADMYNVYHRGYATTAFVSTSPPASNHIFGTDYIMCRPSQSLADLC